MLLAVLWRQLIILQYAWCDLTSSSVVWLAAGLCSYGWFCSSVLLYHTTSQGPFMQILASCWDKIHCGLSALIDLHAYCVPHVARAVPVHMPWRACPRPCLCMRVRVGLPQLAVFIVVILVLGYPVCPNMHVSLSYQCCFGDKHPLQGPLSSARHSRINDTSCRHG